TIPAVLPVTLTYFNGYPSNCNAILNWEAATETNTDHYEVEYSTDGVSYQKLGEVKVQGTGHLYQFDYRPDYSKGYYRLKMMDNDGRFNYSNVVAISTGCDPSRIVLSPNPAKDKVFVFVGLKKISAANLIDGNGRVIQKVKDQLETGINISGLAQGFYYIQMADSNGVVETLKFVKE
ncbi:MAG TPA: T9SS type A sorting domain-containing protein, partial [Puia sp.]|nr:T9SS type A sorting domain-containing protein [Puia sp.]